MMSEEPEPCAVCQPKEWERWRDRLVIGKGLKQPVSPHLCDACRRMMEERFGKRGDAT